jgi:O-acetyl-ADP-ribose deacetylase (regulator of RNase III)
MPLKIVRNDITKMRADAIVNAANTALRMGGGVCGAIFKAAGARELQDACDKLAPIETGGAAITDGFDLPAKFIIHTVGPVYRDGHHKLALPRRRKRVREHSVPPDIERHIWLSERRSASRRDRSHTGFPV